eukprot:TRINITY_DN33696_c0_g1_i1.p1 TRINITY_DN33696_c0_g1~~TRINITY_DN33696_c0_g1_i1.p1  ORF type:complete len:389 (-),score=88.12 TRINITY_DN33696_c0_g1_i1:374-1540(-)
MADDDGKGETFPMFALAQKRSLLLGDDPCPNADKLRSEILEAVKEHSMLPFYDNHLCPRVLGTPDEALRADMKKRNDAELSKLEERIADATENLGDVEVRDALLAKANFFIRIGEKEVALEALQVAFEKTLGIGGKLDIILSAIRIAFFFEDKELAKKEIGRAKAELSKGGDWERRNKLKVYEGLYLLTTRAWKEAATLFLDVMPTFTATELVEFKDFVFYTVIITLVASDRATIRQKLVSSPEVLSVIKETPHLQEFMDSYFKCEYQDFMRAFVPIIDAVKADRYLQKHVRYFTRNMRLNAYKQFLASYRSVKLEAMGTEFGVSPSFIDSELSSFISSGKLTCKIDKVGGVIEAKETDTRSGLYVNIIKHGDLLLNRMQKLAGALDM